MWSGISRYYLLFGREVLTLVKKNRGKWRGVRVESC